MKKLVLTSITLLLMVIATNAQTNWGVKGSLIFNSNGELRELKNEVKEIIDTKGENEVGFNAGIYAKFDLGPVFIRPELVYTKTSSEYNIAGTNSLNTTSIDLPVLVGLKIIGPLNIVVGPAFKYILNNDIKGLDYEDISNNITVGLNIGLSAQLGRLGIDLIYDRGFSENEAKFIGTTADKFTLDTRQQQIKIGLSYRLSEK